MNERKSALFSLDDVSKAEILAAALINAGWEIIASRETVEVLHRAGLPVTDIADFTGVHEDFGFPPTLHPKVEAWLTSRSGPRIDLVYVIPYPTAKGNDVGGRTLVALAAKGGRVPVMSCSDMERAVADIAAHGEPSAGLRAELIEKAWVEISRHYARLAGETPAHSFRSGDHAFDLLNGENPYQVPAAAFRCREEQGDPLALLSFERRSGEPPCFTNMADADCLLETMCRLAEAFRKSADGVPSICIAGKHGNPCGLAVSRGDPGEAVEKALFGDPRSIWGGEVVVNFPVEARLAALLLKSERREKLLGDASWMLDVVLAPSFSDEAVSILGKRAARKLFQNPALADPFPRPVKHEYRSVRGGFLRQPPAGYVLDLGEARREGSPLEPAQVDALAIAWAAAFTSNHGGNEIALAGSDGLLGVGGGPSTVEAARVALSRARECGHETAGALFAADAFFPFTDAPRLLCEAKVSAGLVPAGGKRERDVREYFASRGVAMAYLPEQYRGFCRH